MAKAYSVILDGDRLPRLRETGVEYAPARMLYTSDAAEFARDELFLHERAEEYVYLLALNTHLDLIGVSEVSHGTVGASLVTPREVCQRALLLGAERVILLHNHPSGNAAPSGEDNKVTKQIKNACRIMHVPLVDHVIIGARDSYSYSAAGTL